MKYNIKLKKSNRGRKEQDIKVFSIKGMLPKKFRKKYNYEVIDGDKLVLTKKSVDNEKG